MLDNSMIVGFKADACGQAKPHFIAPPLKERPERCAFHTKALIHEDGPA